LCIISFTLFIKLSPDFSKARLPKQWIYRGSLPFVTINVRPDFPNNGYIVVPYLCDYFMTKKLVRLSFTWGQSHGTRALSGTRPMLGPPTSHEWDLCSPNQRYYVVYDLEWQWFFMAYMLKVHKLSLLVLLAWKNISIGNNRNWLVWQILDDLSIAMVCSRVCYYRPVLEWWTFLKTSQKKMTAHGWLMLVIGNILIVTDWLIE
jgi:hypothetical protein